MTGLKTALCVAVTGAGEGDADVLGVDAVSEKVGWAGATTFGLQLPRSKLINVMKAAERNITFVQGDRSNA
jgi:hypothetical protein